MNTTKKTVEMPKPGGNLQKQMTGNISSAKSIASTKAQEDVAAAINRVSVAPVADDNKPPVVLRACGKLSRTGYKNVSFQMDLELLAAFDAFIGKDGKGAALNHAIALMMAAYLDRFKKDGTAIVADVETGMMGVVSAELEAYIAKVQSQTAD